jgi:hypothetical protein
MSDKKVTITVSGGSISVDPDPVKPKKATDNVSWECDQSFTIDLPGFTVNYRMEGSKFVGVTGTFPTVETLKYSVSSPGAADLDPDVDVQP